MPTTSICIIYARQDKSTARAIHDLLSPPYDVWWDDHIRNGDFRAEIEERLSAAKVVIPIWSRASRVSRHVVDEADFAAKRGVRLVPVRIVDVEAPMGFGRLHTIDLIDWSGDREAESARALLRSIDSIVHRRTELVSGSTKLALPTFFRSVSSHETKLAPAAAVRALRLTQADAILVSAYDIIREEETARASILDDLASCRSNGAIVLLDSGNYEKHRKHDEGWSVDDLHRAMKAAPHDFAFTYDDLDPPHDVDGAIRAVVDAVRRDSIGASAPVLPIVHAPEMSEERLFSVLPEIIAGVATELHPPLLAVPERELGHGIVERARTVYEIRRKLDEVAEYQPLHLLGTGNPLTIAVLAAAGADSFDGLEWCRTVADHETASLFHFDHFDLLAFQSQVADLSVVREAVMSDEIEYSGKVAFHNLEFYRRWIGQVREMVSTGKIDRLLANKLPYGSDALRLLEKAVPEVFG